MTVRELSNRIDAILNKSYGGVAVNEYDKSLYLTRAQSYVVEKALDKYEYGDRIRHILGNLLVDVDLTSSDVSFTGDGYKVLPLQNGVKAIVYEITNGSIETIPMDWNDIHETTRNPFRKPNSEIAYRVTDDLKIRLYTSETFISYSYVYCKQPIAIVLEDLPLGLEIGGLDNSTISELPNDTVLRIIDVAAHLIYQDKGKFIPKPQSVKEK